MPSELHPTEPSRSERAHVDNQLVENSRETVTVTYERMRGPLLPPQALLEYETILPGTAERLLALHEKQLAHQQELEKAESEHRHSNERLELQAGIALDRNGPFFALSAVVLVLSLATYATYCGYPQTAGTITTVVVTGLAIAFLTPRLRGGAEVPEPQVPPADMISPK